MNTRFLGDGALVILYGGSEDLGANRDVQRDYFILKNEPLPGIKDIVLCFGSIGVYYDPEIVSSEEVCHFLQARLEHPDNDFRGSVNTVAIPVYYGGKFGPDLDKIAEVLKMSCEEIIEEHSGSEYTVWGIGFLPGFPYLGRLPAKLAIPRKDTPETKVAAGSVAIAGMQTGIYPVDSPGGWHVIGWTPLKMFNLGRPDPCLLKPGDKVKFTRAETPTWTE
ncbi:MAG: 5-oxoprolinase subunit PxpB [Eubacteriales bacterium]